MALLKGFHSPRLTESFQDRKSTKIERNAFAYARSAIYHLLVEDDDSPVSVECD